jgi:S-adenosylhomocysteine hydrolase
MHQPHSELGASLTPRMKFPRLPVLDALAAHVEQHAPECLAGTHVVAVQHLLESTGSLIDALLRLGVQPRHVHVLGKLYSTHDATARRLAEGGVEVHASSRPTAWGHFAEAMRNDVASLWASTERTVPAGAPLTVLDDGGRCVDQMPGRFRDSALTCGIEQTTSGLAHILASSAARVRVIQVAASAAKRLLEPPMISAAVIERTARLMDTLPSTTTCGVLGLGPIGRAMAEELARRGHRVLAYDPDPGARRFRRDGLTMCRARRDVVRHATVIFGCSGTDALLNERAVLKVRGQLVLASCSSEDREFQALLAGAATDGPSPTSDPFASVGVPIGRNGRLLILRGGYPINFDGGPHSVPAADIQLTRGLLFGAVIQAQRCRSKAGPVMLDPAIQRAVVHTWLDDQPHRRDWYPREVLAQFDNLDSIAKASGGEPVRCADLETWFGMP